MSDPGHYRRCSFEVLLLLQGWDLNVLLHFDFPPSPVSREICDGGNSSLYPHAAAFAILMEGGRLCTSSSFLRSSRTNCMDQKEALFGASGERTLAAKVNGFSIHREY